MEKGMTYLNKYSYLKLEDKTTTDKKKEEVKVDNPKDPMEGYPDKKYPV